ncbi:DUF6036 family nucleotidyltransferase [Roseivirga pacifica]|uniref:DUF6036 family nucleotidyltransferase n=1 Tax=Roseivirga pacifica TaxID=1267423 RepID=UPI00209429C3|nr:DUF6036 family nucleotidyltransferase [Roseivirga pacifica]MCO6357867.1 hypothetical protein [Roseivirga pacifica]MCO6366119.1 hypothetical protein [Roseivirga pacifica]MCO6371447.1 hypothetical protein [Roseivirga pacifica]MCO6375381.1 hypothetical protein [Roseivirga pacifica]MCO6378825.1 hypothetical protein [Roseivirga pacifica]
MNNLFNPDFIDFLTCFNRCGVKYILVGGYSVVLHGYPRTTGDMDLWTECSKENYGSIVRAFDCFDLPVFDMTEDNFLDTENLNVFRFGRPPVAIDLITKVTGLDFASAWNRKEVASFEGLSVNYLHLSDLKTTKLATGRPKDINDLQNLE